MGVVYKGYHEDLDLDVAIKFLHAHRLNQAETGQRFLREARLAARLSHPAIVRVFDCGTVGGHCYLVMEYVDGDSLAALIRRERRLPVARALQITATVAEALDQAQSQCGLIHRDVKPANILITSSGQAKLADLGLAKVLSAEQPVSAHTATGVTLGTPSYMSPEQFEDASRVDHRGDMFSLGATLYDMLTGGAPFRGDSFYQICRQVCESEPPPLPADIPEPVGQIVWRLLRKSPAERFATYQELLAALRVAMEETWAREETGQGSSAIREAASGERLIPQIHLAGMASRTMAPPENRVLLVVDIQNDFCPGGALAVPDGDQVVPVINRLSRRFAHVILTQDWHCEDHLSFASSHPGKKPLESVELSYGPQILWPDHCVRQTWGAEFHAELQIANCQLILRKGYHREVDSYSAFFENDRRTPTGLAGYLRERGLSRIFLAGLATDFCVAYTALDARRLGFEVTVIDEACRGIDVDGSLQSAWQQMLAAGVLRA
ncbi:MAG: bifunctional nicotinamidase/pyrazinamidase [Pirellulaceae bacterium]|nr:bifunctional nicotinamidase/pyrazinamidase [Pirellulaceae bacterium]